MNLNRLTDEEKAELELLLKTATQDTISVTINELGAGRTLTYQTRKMRVADPDHIRVNVKTVGRH